MVSHGAGEDIQKPVKVFLDLYLRLERYYFAVLDPR